MNIQIEIINASTVLTDSQVQSAIPALQTQISSHFAPVWGIDATLTFFPQGSSPDPNSWWLVVLDNSDQSGDLGYHYNDLTTHGLPLGKVFAATDLQAGSQWTVTASHELLEMLCDPDINLCAYTTLVENDPSSLMRLYAYEVADACEADQDGYKIGEILVSDFVYPAWFESFRAPNSTQFDYQNKITAPFQLLSGGYAGIYDVTSGTGWQQMYADKANLSQSMRARVGSRRERRRTFRSHWLKSIKLQRTITTPSTTPI